MSERGPGDGDADFALDGLSPSEGGDLPPSLSLVSSERVEAVELDDAELALVDSGITRQQTRLAACHEVALGADPDVAGSLAVRWMVREGLTQGVALVQDAIGNVELARCVVDKVKRWRFEATVEGTITQRFTFTKLPG